MTVSFSTQSLSELLEFPFRSPNWQKKIGIGFLLNLFGVPLLFIPTIFFWGYQVRIMRSMILENREPFLPEWDDWEKMFKGGLKIASAGFLIMLPVMALLFTGYGAMLLPAFLAPMAEENGSGYGLVMLLGMGCGWLFMGIAMLLGMVIGVIMPVALCHLVAKDSFGAAFNFSEWGQIFRANIGGFLLAYLVIVAASMMLSIVAQMLIFTIVLCWAYPILMTLAFTYFGLVRFAFYAHNYRIGVDKLALNNAAARTSS